MGYPLVREIMYLNMNIRFGVYDFRSNQYIFPYIFKNWLVFEVRDFDYLNVPYDTNSICFSYFQITSTWFKYT